MILQAYRFKLYASLKMRVPVNARHHRDHHDHHDHQDHMRIL